MYSGLNPKYTSSTPRVLELLQFNSKNPAGTPFI